jgi:hypothetical protein
MAENKKSFVLYSDSQGLINQLPDDVAGRLLKHIYAYVNDENPISNELLLNIAFEPIKMQLKRDLIKWEQTLEGRSKAGKASAEARRLAKEKEQMLTNSTNVDFVQQTSTNSTDNVNVNVNVNDNDNVNDIKKNNITASPKNFSFYNSLIDYGFDKNLVSDWLKVRKTKKATNTETAFKNFISEIEKRNCILNEILEFTIIRNWSGFKWTWYDAEIEKEKSSAKKEKENEPIVIGRQTMSTVMQNLDTSGVYNPWLEDKNI